MSYRRKKYYQSKRRPSWQSTPPKGTGRDRGQAPFDKAKVKKMIFGIFLTASLVWYVYFFLFSDNFQIKEITFSGLDNIPAEEIRAIAGETLAARRGFIFPNNNIFLFSEQSLADKIGERYIVDSVAATKDYPFGVDIKIEEKLARVSLRLLVPQEPLPAVPAETTTTPTPSASVAIKGETAENCLEEVCPAPEEANAVEEKAAPKAPVYEIENYLVDVNGIVVSRQEAPREGENAGAQDFPLIEMVFDRQTQTVKPGDEILDRETIGYIFTVYETVEQFNPSIKIKYVIYDPRVKDEIKFATAEGWQAFLSRKLDLDTQIKKLNLALAEKIQDKRASLQYVDLRIRDRVYYK